MIPMGITQFETSDNMKLVGLTIKLTKELCSTGKAVIMDSGLCVLKGLLEIRKRWVYGSELIKKRRYWPRYVHVDGINEYFRSKRIGNVGCISG